MMNLKLTYRGNDYISQATQIKDEVLRLATPCK